jgi:hypothetical protein
MQKCRISRPGGFRLGDLVDAVKEGFDGVDGDVRKKVKWVAIESCREDVKF